MPIDFMSLTAFVIGAIVAAVTSAQAVSKAARLQQEIAKRGVAAHGKVLQVWRPPVWGAFTRIHFEFLPNGAREALRLCHVDRRLAGEMKASLPAVGATVGVKYLPDNPTQAVIAKLVSRAG